VVNGKLKISSKKKKRLAVMSNPQDFVVNYLLIGATWGKGYMDIH